MALNPLNSSSLEQLGLKGLTFPYDNFDFCLCPNVKVRPGREW